MSNHTCNIIWEGMKQSIDESCEKTYIKCLQKQVVLLLAFTCLYLLHWCDCAMFYLWRLGVFTRPGKPWKETAVMEKSWIWLFLIKIGEISCNLSVRKSRNPKKWVSYKTVFRGVKITRWEPKNFNIYEKIPVCCENSPSNYLLFHNREIKHSGSETSSTLGNSMRWFTAPS